MDSGHPYWNSWLRFILAWEQNHHTLVGKKHQPSDPCLFEVKLQPGVKATGHGLSRDIFGQVTWVSLFHTYHESGDQTRDLFVCFEFCGKSLCRSYRPEAQAASETCWCHMLGMFTELVVIWHEVWSNIKLLLEFVHPETTKARAKNDWYTVHMKA